MTDRINENAVSSRENPNSELSLDVERELMPARTPEVDSDQHGQPPARSGNVAENREKPTEGDPVDNPTHHTGHIPPPVTANRD